MRINPPGASLADDYIEALGYVDFKPTFIDDSHRMKSAKLKSSFSHVWVVAAVIMLSRTCLHAEFPPDFLSSAVLIKMPAPNGQSGGSGFYYQTESNIFLVTARHVLFGRDPNSTNLMSASAALISYTSPETSDEKFQIEVDLEQARLAGNIRRHPTTDVAVVKLAAIQSSENNVYHVSYLAGAKRPTGATSGNYKRFTTNDVSPYSVAKTGSDIVMIGFPRSLASAPTPVQLIDAEKPLLRHGVISGRNAQLRLLIVDAASFQGNSGGPVVQLVEIPNVFPKRSDYKLVGLVGGFIPHTEVWGDQYQTSGAIINANSGYSYVLPMDAVFELLQQEVTVFRYYAVARLSSNAFDLPSGTKLSAGFWENCLKLRQIISLRIISLARSSGQQLAC